MITSGRTAARYARYRGVEPVAMVEYMMDDGMFWGMAATGIFPTPPLRSPSPR